MEARLEVGDPAGVVEITMHVVASEDIGPIPRIDLGALAAGGGIRLLLERGRAGTSLAVRPIQRLRRRQLAAGVLILLLWLVEWFHQAKTGDGPRPPALPKEGE